MVSFDSWYFILNLVLLLVFTAVGQVINNKRMYWIHASWCVVAFTLISGLRYARGNDYIHYTEIFTGFDTQANSAFIWLNECLAYWGFNEYSCFLFYAFVFVTCGLFFLRDFIHCAKWTFPLFVIGYLYFEEFQIRQAFSYSFFFVFMHYLFLLPNQKINIFQQKYLFVLLKILFWGALCISMHTANLVLIFLLVVAYVFSKYMIPYYVVIPLYIASVYIIPHIFDFSLLELFLSPFSELETTSHYVANADYFFTEEGANEIYTRNPIIQIYEVAGVSALFYLVSQLKNKLDCHYARVVSVFYHMFFLGISILSAFRELEILNRMGHDISFCWIFLLSLLLTYTDDFSEKQPVVASYYSKVRVLTRSTMTKLYARTVFKAMCYLSLTWFLYDYLKYILMPGKMTLYIWDAPIGVSLF